MFKRDSRDCSSGALALKTRLGKWIVTRSRGRIYQIIGKRDIANEYYNPPSQEAQPSGIGQFHRRIRPPAMAGPQNLFGDDAVGPFDQRNEDGRIAELCVPIRKIVFRDPTGPGASSSSKDRNVFGDNLLAQLAERRPTNGNHGVRGSFAHKIVRVSRQEYLNFVASVRQRRCMREHERRSGWVVGPPRTSHQDPQSFFRFLRLRS